MKILITGCAGYIGSTLVDILTKNTKNTVIGIDNFFYKNQYAIQGFLNRSNFEFHRKDIRDIESYKNLIDKSNIVVHLAAIVGAGICDKYPEVTKQVNLEATKKLIESLTSQKLVYANSNSGYGANGGVCTEETPINPVSLYGQTKLEAEQYVLGAGGVSFRLATVFGTSFRQRMDLMVNDFVQKLSFNNGITLFEPTFHRNFLHVKDVCSAIMIGFDPSIKGVYNLGLDSANCTKLELAQRVRDLVNPKAYIQVGQGKDPDQRDYLISSEKATRELGWKPVFQLEDGINEVRKLCEIYSKDQLESMGNYILSQ